MNMKIRSFTEADYETVSEWVKEYPTPSKELLTKSSTFVLEVDGNMMFVLTVYFTNCKEICFVENFMGNPEFKDERKAHSQLLFTYVEKLAKDYGYKHIVGFSNVDKLTHKYESFGYRKLTDNLCALGKGL